MVNQTLTYGNKMKTYQEFLAESMITESLPALKTTAKDGDKVGMGHLKDWTVKKFKDEYATIVKDLPNADKAKKKELSARLNSFYTNVSDDALADQFSKAAKAALKA